MSLKISFLIVAIGVILCHGQDDTSVKSFNQILNEVKQNLQLIKQNVRDSAVNSRDALSNTIRSLFQFKYDIFKTFINYKKTTVQNFIAHKLDRINAIKKNIEELLNKRIHVTTIEEMRRQIEDEKRVITANLYEIETIGNELQDYLNELTKNEQGPQPLPQPVPYTPQPPANNTQQPLPQPISEPQPQPTTNIPPQNGVEIITLRSFMCPGQTSRKLICVFGNNDDIIGNFTLP